MKALVFEGTVVQIAVVEFPVASALSWVDITGIDPSPEVGWAYDGTKFTAPPAESRPPKSDARLTAEELATLLIDKGTVTRGDIDTIKTDR